MERLYSITVDSNVLPDFFEVKFRQICLKFLKSLGLLESLLSDLFWPARLCHSHPHQNGRADGHYISKALLV